MKIIQITCNGTDEDTGFNKGYLNTGTVDIGVATVLHDVALYEEGILENREYPGVGIMHKNSFANFWGGIYGYGIEKQSSEIANLVRESALKYSYEIIKVNFYGFSRGGIVILSAIKKINKMCSMLNNIEISLSLCEPVPGNFQATTYIDLFKVTLCNQVINCEQDKFIRNVKIFITAAGKSLETQAHMPIIPKFNAKANTELYVITGLHKSGQLWFKDGPVYYYTYPGFFVFNETLNLFGGEKALALYLYPKDDIESFSIELNKERKKYRTVFTAKGKADLVPNIGTLKNKAYFTQFDINCSSNLDRYLLAYNSKNANVKSQVRFLSAIEIDHTHEKEIFFSQEMRCMNINWYGFQLGKNIGFFSTAKLNARLFLDSKIIVQNLISKQDVLSFHPHNGYYKLILHNGTYYEGSEFKIMSHQQNSRVAFLYRRKDNSQMQFVDINETSTTWFPIGNYAYKEGEFNDKFNNLNNMWTEIYKAFSSNQNMERRNGRYSIDLGQGTYNISKIKHRNSIPEYYEMSQVEYDPEFHKIFQKKFKSDCGDEEEKLNSSEKEINIQNSILCPLCNREILFESDSESSKCNWCQYIYKR